MAKWMAGPKCKFQILFITGPSIFILSFWGWLCQRKEWGREEEGKDLEGG